MQIDKFVHDLSGEAESTGHYRKYEVYRSTLRRVCSYCDNDSPSLDEVFTPGFLFNFQEYLLMDGLILNTVSFYMSTLRSIYKPAVAAGEMQNIAGLFSAVFTGHVPTKKRALPPEAVACIYAADLSEHPRLERCRNIFMASLFFQGIPFTDLLHLRTSDLQDDLLTYIRQKTGKPVCVFVLDEARAFLDRLTDDRADTPYLLPFITRTGKEGYSQYQSALHLYNRHLKELAAHLGITDTITSYTARHTWATMAHNNNVSIAAISEGMGHKTEEMTQVYISSFGRERMKEANQAVFNAVLQPIREGMVTDVREEVWLNIKAQEQEQPQPQPQPVVETMKEELQRMEALMEDLKEALKEQQLQIRMLMALQQQAPIVSEQEIKTMVENFIQREIPDLRNFMPEEEQQPGWTQQQRMEKEEKKRNVQRE
jgi:integrase